MGLMSSPWRWEVLRGKICRQVQRLWKYLLVKVSVRLTVSMLSMGKCVDEGQFVPRNRTLIVGRDFPLAKNQHLATSRMTSPANVFFVGKLATNNKNVQMIHYLNLVTFVLQQPMNHVRSLWYLSPQPPLI
jgi:hypothetical protein